MSSANSPEKRPPLKWDTIAVYFSSLAEAGVGKKGQSHRRFAQIPKWPTRIDSDNISSTDNELFKKCKPFLSQKTLKTLNCVKSKDLKLWTAFSIAQFCIVDEKSNESFITSNCARQALRLPIKNVAVCDVFLKKILHQPVSPMEETLYQKVLLLIVSAQFRGHQTFWKINLSKYTAKSWVLIANIYKKWRLFWCGCLVYVTCFSAILRLTYKLSLGRHKQANLINESE